MNTYTIAKTLIASPFIAHALVGIYDFKSFTNMARFAGLPIPIVWALLSIIIQLGAGISLLQNANQPYASYALIMYIIAITYLFHSKQFTHFLKNLIVIGALLLLI